MKFPPLFNPNLLRVDTRNPVNWDHPLNRGRSFWGYGLPGVSGGLSLPDLCDLSSLAVSGGALPTWTPYGGGVNMAGASGGQAASSYVPNRLRLSFPLSFACWVKVVSQGGNYPAIFGISYDSSNDSPFFAFCLNMYGGGVLIQINNAGSGSNWILGFTSSQYAAWTRVLVAFAPNGTATYYQNGAAYATYSSSGSSPIYTATSQIVIGQVPGSGTVTINEQVADCSIWNRQLSASDAQADYVLSNVGYPGVLNRLGASMLPVFGGAKAAASYNGGLMMFLRTQECAPTITTVSRPNRRRRWRWRRKPNGIYVPNLALT